VTYIDPNGCAAWVAEHANVDFASAATVLAVEFEYMLATGIAVGDPPGTEQLFEFRHYDPAELAGEPPVVDTLRIAQDAERLADVPEEIGHRVLEAELHYLEMRGLA
jgi:hypothetical protein